MNLGTAFFGRTARSLKLPTLLAVSLLSFCSHAQPDVLEPRQKPADQEEHVEALLQKHRVPALGVGIIKNGMLRHVKVYGSLREGHPAPYDALFNVASLTKPIVALVALKLVEKGVWKLDEPLYHYWTDPDVATDPNHKKLTTRHVLSHQTGFVNWRWLHKTKKLAFDSEPGTQLGYSGEGFEYLRKALEAKFKQPLQQLSNTLIFAPLGMQSTQYFWDGTTPTDRFAHWHDAEGKNAYQNFRTEKENAADDLLTTVEDYGRFAVHVMSGAGLSPQLFAEMISPHARIKQHDDMGLGWEIITQLANNEYAMLHSGSDVGVKTLVVLLPKSKEGLVLFTNGDNGFDVIAELLPLYLSVGKELMARS